MCVCVLSLLVACLCVLVSERQIHFRLTSCMHKHPGTLLEQPELLQQLTGACESTVQAMRDAAAAEAAAEAVLKVRSN